MLGLRNLDYYQGKVDALNDTNFFLDTLEVKEIGVDIGSPDGNSSVKTILDGDKIVSNKVQKDKVQKIKEWVKIRKQCTMAAPMKFYCKEAESDYNILCTIEKILNFMQEETVSEDLDSFATKYAQDKPYPVTVCQAVRVGANWQKEQFEKNRLKHCDSITNEQAELEQGFIDQHLDKYQRMPTFLDAIEYGMNLQNRSSR